MLLGFCEMALRLKKAKSPQITFPFAGQTGTCPLHKQAMSFLSIPEHNYQTV
jgi:hypothetical protein